MALHLICRVCVCVCSPVYTHLQRTQFVTLLIMQNNWLAHSKVSLISNNRLHRKITHADYIALWYGVSVCMTAAMLLRPPLTLMLLIRPSLSLRMAPCFYCPVPERAFSRWEPLFSTPSDIPSGPPPQPHHSLWAHSQRGREPSIVPSGILANLEGGGPNVSSSVCSGPPSRLPCTYLIYLIAPWLYRKDDLWACLTPIWCLLASWEPKGVTRKTTGFTWEPGRVENVC